MRYASHPSAMKRIAKSWELFALLGHSRIFLLLIITRVLVRVCIVFILQYDAWYTALSRVPMYAFVFIAFSTTPADVWF